VCVSVYCTTTIIYFNNNNHILHAFVRKPIVFSVSVLVCLIVVKYGVCVCVLYIYICTHAFLPSSHIVLLLFNHKNYYCVSLQLIVYSICQRLVVVCCVYHASLTWCIYVHSYNCVTFLCRSCSFYNEIILLLFYYILIITFCLFIFYIRIRI